MARKDIPQQRREQLIQATCATINQVGLPAVTISQVASQAGLSTGIISHYFGDKEGLLYATMRKILLDLHDAIARLRQAAPPDAMAQIKAIIDGNFDESQVNQQAMRTWLDFWAASMHQAELRRLQRINDLRLYSNLCFQFRRCLPRTAAQQAAKGLAALIDGLWLRGSLTGSDFDVNRAKSLAYQYAQQCLHHPFND